MAGDFRYFTPALGAGDAVVGVTASGEFRDVLATFERLEGRCLRIGITHVPDSSITPGGCHTHRRRRAKSGSGHDEDLRQHAHGRSPADARTLLGFRDYFADLEASAARAAAAISEAEKSVPYLVPELSEVEHAFCFGAGNAYAAALEGALKMKEMPLLHAEGSETWEMASGPSTMVDERALCVALYTTARKAMNRPPR